MAYKNLLAGVTAGLLLSVQAVLGCIMTDAAEPKSPSKDVLYMLGFYYGNGENILIREADGELELLYKYTAEDVSFAKANRYPMTKLHFDSYTINEAGPMGGSETAVHFDRDPDGYAITTDTTFTISADGKVIVGGSEVEGNHILIENALTHVSISKVDVAGEELEGATIVLYKDSVSDDNVVETWVSDGETAHVINGLLTDTTYILRETVAPTGYDVTTDTTFTLNADGTVDAANTTTTVRGTDGVLLVEDDLLPDTTNVINKTVFKIFLPALLFMDVAEQDFVSMWDTEFVLFCFIVTCISIVVSFFLSMFDKDKEDRGEFIQASYRSAAATLGIAFMTNVYDNVAMVALMILGAVPLYNIMAVIILSLTAKTDEQLSFGSLMKRTLKNIVTNPIILSILAGFVWSILKLPQPVIFVKSLTYLGNVASPLALIGLGASFEFAQLKEKLVPIIMVNFNKLMLFCIVFLPVGIYLGFRDEKIVAALIMLGSATTSSKFLILSVLILFEMLRIDRPKLNLYSILFALQVVN